MRTETRTAPVAPGIGGIPYKWLALSVTMVGTLMAAIDSSIVVLAFPAMLVDLRADLTSLIWVLMGYSLMTTVSLLNRGIGLGFTSPIILGLFGASVAFGVAFYFWSRAAEHPVLDFKLFRSRLFVAAVSTSTLQTLAIFAVNLLIVYYLEVVQGRSPLNAAFALVPLSIVSSVVSPFGGTISDRVGARRPVAIGLLALAIGLVILSTLQVGSSYLHVVVGLLIMGLGSGLTWAPITSTAMSSAPRNRLGVASATLATWRNTGMVVSYALSLAIAAAAVPADAQNQLFLGQAVNLSPVIAAAFVDGMHAALHLSIAICTIAAIGWWFAAAPADDPARRSAAPAVSLPAE